MNEVKVEVTFKRVDFPHPLGPRRIQSCPDGILREQSLRMGTKSPFLVLIEKFRFLPSMAILLSFSIT
jgi:hypothetical protein